MEDSEIRATVKVGQEVEITIRGTIEDIDKHQSGDTILLGAGEHNTWVLDDSIQSIRVVSGEVPERWWDHYMAWRG